MGLAEARRYIRELHRRQADPSLWPDYLTGLPDKRAIIMKLGEIYPNLGRFSVGCVRIANVQSFILKYGPDRHAEIVQWAAAILKTTVERCPKSFVGTLNTHEFIVMCETGIMAKLLASAAKDFRKKMSVYYDPEDLLSGEVPSGRKRGRGFRVSPMKLISVVADRPKKIGQGDLIRRMSDLCDAVEASGEDSATLTDSVSK